MNPDERRKELNEAAIEAFKQGYNKAAENPEAWWVPDKNGSQIHIGDRAKHPSWYGGEETETVIALGKNEIHCNGYSAPADKCEKVTDDPWEGLRIKIVRAMAANQWGGKTLGEISAGFIQEAKEIALQELAQKSETTEEFLKATGNE